MSGIRAAQVGIDVASNNVANANTAGHTRQRVEFAALPTFGIPAGQLGTGVDIHQLHRMRDDALDVRYRAAAADERFALARTEHLTRMEDAAGEPGHGVNVQLGELWDSLEDWANQPADEVARIRVLSELDALVGRVGALSSAWHVTEQQVVAEIDHLVDRGNRLLSDLATLDARVANLDATQVDPTLLDTRDRLLDEAAELLGATSTIDGQGRARVMIDGQELLAEGRAGQLERDGHALRLLDPDGVELDADVGVGGALGGLQHVVRVDLPAAHARLDTFVEALTDQVNGVNGAGWTADGSQGGDLLAHDGVAPSATLSLAVGRQDTHLLAAAGHVDGDGNLVVDDDGYPGAADGVNAARFADLAVRAHPDGSVPTIETRQVDGVVGLAADLHAARREVELMRGMANGAAISRAAEHGVSIDEEMVDLVRYQRALEAASRVMTTVDEALDVLINRTGRVGR